MTSVIIEDVEDFIDKIKAEFKPAIKTVENDVKAAGSAALNYIETNGLQDLYQIAVSAVTGAIAGAPWLTTLSTIETQAVAAGKSIEKGAVAIVAAQAQADLIAAGQLLPPTATAA